MGWIESKSGSTKELVRAIIELREHLHETQDEFAVRLRISKRAIANYAKHRRPTVMVLARLTRAASDCHRNDLANLFLSSLAVDLELPILSEMKLPAQSK